ncbi:hypothetical protein [Helicobacter cinaedi]|uniref:hypothetical protein n=1 Tax=Helicobacter cinaedi TaxID=213 RepID=UPI0011CCC89E|nr:hypothetical protein [Helicobacter cinaedi]
MPLFAKISQTNRTIPLHSLFQRLTFLPPLHKSLVHSTASSVFYTSRKPITQTPQTPLQTPLHAYTQSLNPSYHKAHNAKSHFCICNFFHKNQKSLQIIPQSTQNKLF